MLFVGTDAIEVKVMDYSPPLYGVVGRPNCNIKIQEAYRKLLFYYFYQGNERQTHATLKSHYVYSI